MKINDNTEMLELPWQQGTLYPVLVWDSNEVILVDTGFPWQFEEMRAAVGKAGFSLERITKIILTHYDMDHTGCAKRLKGLGAKVMAHKKETPYIQGDLPSPKLLKMEARLKELSEEELAIYERIKTNAPNLYVHVDEMLKDGGLLPFCGGIEVIHTPGHTPGHICLLLRDGNVLITGDAANATDGIMTGPNPKHTLDMAQGTESFERLKELKPDFIVCYHGGLCSIK